MFFSSPLIYFLDVLQIVPGLEIFTYLNFHQEIVFKPVKHTDQLKILDI